MKKTLFHFIFTTTAFTVLLQPMQVLCAEEPSISKQVSQDFTSVAKKAIPTVVSIQVKGPDAQFFTGEDQEIEGFEDPFGMMPKDLFQQFFGRQKRLTPKEQPFSGQASGFIVSEDGKILTNNHVVRNASKIRVILNDGREFDAKVIGQDPNTDIAVVQIDAKNLPHLILGNSDNLEVGQWVVAIGNPLGLQASLTVGVVSATGRNNLDIARIEDFIQTDATINRGNSGGPLLDLNGNVIGINTAIASNMGGFMGIGFAIPSNMANHVMHELIDNGSVSRGYLGVTLQSVDQNLAQAFGLDAVTGALVADIRSNSPAQTAGLKQGDIILEYNGTKVGNITSLRNAISMMKPGTRTSLSVLRDGKKMEIPVNIGMFPSTSELAGQVENKLGFEVEDVTPSIAKNLSLLNDKGVIVSKVRPGSPSAWAGIQKGALIVEVNKSKVETKEQFNKALESTPEGQPVLLLIKQDDQKRFISLKVG